MLRSLNRKLSLVAGLVVIIVIIFTTATIANLLELREQADALVITTQRASFSGSFDTNIVRAAGELATFVQTTNPEYWAEASVALTRAEEDLTQIETLIAQGPGDANERVVLGELLRRQHAVLAQLEAAGKECVEAFEHGDMHDDEGMLAEVFAYEDAAATLREDLSAYYQTERDDRQRAVRAALSNAIISITASVLTLLLLLLLFAILMHRLIVRPIKLLSEAATSVAGGDLAHTTAVSNRDEIGDLQQAFNGMVLNLRAQRQTLDLRAAELAHAASEAQAARAFAEEANRAKSAFLATMSHELRTPLTAILGYTQLLKMEAQLMAAASCEQDLARIEISSRHLLSLISDVLEFSKIEAGRADLRIERFDISESIDEIITAMQPLVSQNRNRLEVSLPEHIGSMYSDRTKLRQVLFNLLGNAAKFTEAGEIRLTVAREQDAETEWVLFTIADTGIGIDEPDLEKLFQEFTQLDASRSRKYGGTGLGLALSRRLCQLLGGDIYATSKLGHGSTFVVRLPSNTPVSIDAPTDTMLAT